MFYCLRPFRQVYALHGFPDPVTVVFLGLRRKIHASPFNHANSTQLQKSYVVQPIVHANESRLDTRLHTLTDTKLLSLINQEVDSRENVSNPTKRSSSSSHAQGTRATSMRIYLELRRRGLETLLMVSPETFVHIARHCMVADKRDVLHFVIQDVIALTNHLNDDSGNGLGVRRFRALEKFLHVIVGRHKVASGQGIGLQQYTLVVGLCKALLLARRPLEIQPDLSVDCLSGVLKSIISQPTDWFARNAPFLEALVNYIQATPLDKFARIIRHSAASRQIRELLIWHCLCLARLLFITRQHDLSFSFLQVLVEKEIVPPEAIRLSGAELEPQVFGTSVVLYTCAHHGWPARASKMLRSDDLVRPELQAHHSDFVNVMLESCISNDIEKLDKCGRLIYYVLRHNPAIKLHAWRIAQFFRKAQEIDARKAAEIMYAALQSRGSRRQPHSLSTTVFQRRVLPWLLEQLVYESQNSLLGKFLAQDLVKAPRPIDPYARGNVVALCAAGGYVKETRALWERYAAEPDGTMVTGHTVCMLRVVKLFKKIGDIVARKPGDRTRSERNQTIPDGTNRTKAASEVVPGGPTDVGAATLENKGGIDGTPKSQSVPDTSSPSGEALSETLKVLADSGINEEVDSIEAEATGFSRTKVESRLMANNAEHPVRSGGSEAVTRNAVVAGAPGPDQYFNFAFKVLEAFQSTKQPLNRASHYDLNALARAWDVLGVVRQSMQALQIVVDRKEVPDTYDLNVIVIAMASRNLDRAEAMLVRMIEERLHTNAHSFSGIILEALRQDQLYRASRVYSRAVRAGQKELLPEAAKALLFACLDSCYPSGTPRVLRKRAEPEVKNLLRQAYTLTMTKACVKTIETHELGSRCVGAALHLDEAGLAFHFWKRLVQTTVPWNSAEHKEIRHAIAAKLEEARAKGEIGDTEGALMISELGRQVRKAA